MSSSDVLPSQRCITDKVQLVAPMAVGGMSRVFLAHHDALDAEVVVKLVDPSRLARDPNARKRFTSEARIASRLSSPHVVRVFDVGISDDDEPFIVMERLRGETLAQRLERGPLDPGELVTIVAQVASALEEAHAQGVVHRDVKPANIFLVESALGPFAKVLDFGVAKLVDGDDHATQSGALMGTPAYMSPEQLLDARDVDHRSDLWSLAVVAYEALVGRRPFRGANVGALSLAICNGCFDLPSEHQPQLPAAIDGWFARALSLTVDDRFPSALELAQKLAEALDEPSPELSTAACALPAPSSAPSPAVDGKRRGLGAATRWVVVAVVPAAFALYFLGRDAALLEVDSHLPTVASSEALAEEHLEAGVAPEPAPPAGAATSEARRQRGEPSSTEPAAAPAASTSAVPTPAKRPPGPQPLPAAPPPAVESVPPDYCETDEAFVADERGVLRPRKECL